MIVGGELWNYVKYKKIYIMEENKRYREKFD